MNNENYIKNLNKIKLQNFDPRFNLEKKIIQLCFLFYSKKENEKEFKMKRPNLSPTY